MTNENICLISEVFPDNPGEGFCRYTVSFARTLKNTNNGFFVVTGDLDSPDSDFVHRINLNKLFLSIRLRQIIKKNSPSLIIYIPFSSLTIWSYIRCKLLSLLTGAKVVIIGLQPRDLSAIKRKIIKTIQPWQVFVQSEYSRAVLLSQGFKSVKLIDSGVDLNKFQKVSHETKVHLRNENGLDRSKYTILHVGHLRKGRNIERLVDLAQNPLNQVIIVCSPYTCPEHELSELLARNHIHIINRYLPNIQEIYQLSDLYYFPVVDPSESIEMPLSVLEALACNIPVLTTNFGGLSKLAGQQGIHFIDDGDIRCQVELIKKLGVPDTCWIKHFSWEAVARRFLEDVYRS